LQSKLTAKAPFKEYSFLLHFHMHTLLLNMHALHSQLHSS
jgi:hypothetical protein